jgi:ABC-type phosphate transport system permease subunit
METNGNHRYRKFKNAAMNVLSVGCAVLVISPLGFILFYLLRQGVQALSWEFFTKLPAPVGQTGGGMADGLRDFSSRLIGMGKKVSGWRRSSGGWKKSARRH